MRTQCLIYRIVICCFCLLFARPIHAQRIAVMEFKAGVGVSTADVDGLSSIFITYFSPGGYTLVERTQIDKIIDEQKFQRGTLSEAQMVRVGQILNLSKIVVGNINVIMGEYNVDVRVINVESGTISATEGISFKQSSYRETMKDLAIKLADQISTTPKQVSHPTIKLATEPIEYSLAVKKNGLRFFVTKDQYYELEGDLTGYEKEGVVISFCDGNSNWCNKKYAILGLTDYNNGSYCSANNNERAKRPMLDIQICGIAERKHSDYTGLDYCKVDVYDEAEMILSDIDKLNSALNLFGGDSFSGLYWTDFQYQSFDIRGYTYVRYYYFDTEGKQLDFVCYGGGCGGRKNSTETAKSRALYKL